MSKLKNKYPKKNIQNKKVGHGSPSNVVSILSSQELLLSHAALAFEFKRSEKYLNRDLSWLKFNERVLHQAEDAKRPLLERVRFLSIFSSNLDEFFMKRFGNIKRKIANDEHGHYAEGSTPQEIFPKLRDAVVTLVQRQNHCFANTILPELRMRGIVLMNWMELTDEDKLQLAEYFRNKIFPVLTPLAVDPAHPFPFLSNLSVSLGVKLHAPKDKKTLFARIKIPDALSQWVPLSGNLYVRPLRMVRLLDIIENNLKELFPEMVIDQVLPFRVTRSADIDLVDDDPEDLLEEVEEELRKRRMADVVRLEYIHGKDDWFLKLLGDELDITHMDIYASMGELNYRTLDEIANLPFPELKNRPWVPITVPRLRDNDLNIFEIIKKGDLFVHHPYESFSTSVERFVRTAVEDPKVLAIKMTVYRTGEMSPFIPLLIEAAEAGKQVVCVVEVKARFDEARNLFWAEKLEKVGVHVVYGVVGLKTHTKVCLIVRREKDDFNFYAHVGTGNYNADTAKLYTDLGLFTCRPSITSELLEIFNYLTGLSLKRKYQKLLVSPINMRERFMQLIEREIENHKKGLPAGIIAKMNSLEDVMICEQLYKASQAGVKIKLIIRGLCILRPQVPGLSENIEVVSIIGRFLEHSRIFYFRGAAKNQDQGLFYLGSADWMHRNLNNRVETVVPIEDPKLKKQCWNILAITLKDQTEAWKLTQQGEYILPPDALHHQFASSQAQLMDLARDQKL